MTRFPGAKAFLIQNDLAAVGYVGFKVRLERNMRTKQFFAQVYRYADRHTSELYTMQEPSLSDWVQMCVVAAPLGDGGKAVTIGERIRSRCYE